MSIDIPRARFFSILFNYYYAIMLFFLIGGIDPIFYYLSECLVLFSVAKVMTKCYTVMSIVLQCCNNAIRLWDLTFVKSVASIFQV